MTVSSSGAGGGGPGAPVMLGSDGGRVINGGSVHARLLVAHDHPPTPPPSRCR